MLKNNSISDIKIGNFNKMKIAIVGDIHGGIKEMYETVSLAGDEISSIIQLGDFKALRNKEDLRYFSAPEKYKTLGDFPEFYNTGSVPRKTYFIGGNHDNDFWHMQDPNGREIIKNLIYLGRAGKRCIDGLSVGFVSGNYSLKAFNSSDKQKYRHFNSEDIQKVIIQKPIDILLLHDWPSVDLLKKYAVTEQPDTEKKDLGNEELFKLVEKVKPRYVFAGHMHTPFNLETVIDGSKVDFIALNQFPEKNSICIFDTEEKNALSLI